MSVARQREILAAFIDLVAQRGLERVTMEDVAEAAGVRRAGLHHFVGTREELIVAAVDELCRRYTVTVRTAVGESPSVDGLMSVFFSDEWARDQSTEDEAFDSLVAEAVRYPQAHGAITTTYDLLLDEVASALRREYPSASDAQIRDIAYSVVCLVEQNTTFQQLGYPRARHLAARNAALRLIDELGFRRT